MGWNPVIFSSILKSNFYALIILRWATVVLWASCFITLLQDLLNFVGCLEDASEHYKVFVPGKETLFSHKQYGSLKEVGIDSSCVLQVMWLNQVQNLLSNFEGQIYTVMQGYFCLWCKYQSYESFYNIVPCFCESARTLNLIRQSIHLSASH